MALNYFASSPTVVLPPQQSQGYFSHHKGAHSPPAMAAVSNSSAGRKRSIADVDDPEENQPVGAVVTQLPVKAKGEPIYGPGMTLIYPGEPGYSMTAESQSGTWFEEKIEKEEKEESVRPIAVSRKSARISPSRSIEVPSLNDMDAQKTEDLIDDNGNTINTLINSLGVGWKNVMTNPNLRDAARAYSRVIERHFDFTDALVMLEKESLSAYLVRAKQHGVQGYWLFSDSLQWCQLVGWSLERTVANLMSGPTPRVEGERINARRLTPSAPTTPFAQPVVDTPAGVDAMEM
ncbi:hypothetical protein NX059_011997 [Plenodomus lindquistii]|nr:hypothetical protein NX059_011997 [Plenodomus lindquistii]